MDTVEVTTWQIPGQARNKNYQNTSSVVVSSTGVTQSGTSVDLSDYLNLSTKLIQKITGLVNFLSGLQIGDTIVSETSLANWNAAYLSITLKSWKGITTVNTWSRVCRIDGYGNYMLNVMSNQSDQSSSYTYVIGLGYRSANIHVLSSSGYKENAAMQIRITRSDSDYNVFYVEVINSFDYDGDGLCNLDCALTGLSGNMSVTTYTTYTATETGAVVMCSIDANYLAMVMQAIKIAGTADIGEMLTANNGITIGNGTKSVILSVDTSGNLVINGNLKATGGVTAYE